MNYRDYNDYELLSYAKEKNEDSINILYQKYEPLILSRAKKFDISLSNIGLDRNDLIQEGRLGFLNAIEQYDQSQDTLFYTYAKASIEKRMLSAITAGKRQKHRILNESLSLEGEDDSLSLIDILSNQEDNPENKLLSIETTNNLLFKMHSRLTTLEGQVFELKLNGFNYKEIASILDREPKNIDNALQRIRNKLKTVVQEKE